MIDAASAPSAHRTNCYSNCLLCAPRFFCILLFALAIAFTGAAFAAPIDVDLTLGAFVARNHPVSRLLDAWSVSSRNFLQHSAPDLWSAPGTPASRKRQTTDTQSTGSVRRWAISVVIEADTSVTNGSTLVPLEQRPNVITPANVAYFRALQRAVESSKSFRQYCWTELDTGLCREPASLLLFLYPRDGSANGRGTEMIDIDSALRAAIVERSYQFTDKLFSLERLRSSLFRIEFHYGTPLVGFLSNNDRREQQLARFNDYMAEFVAHMRNDTGALPPTPLGLKVYYGGSELTPYQVLRAVEHDALLAVGSVILIFLLTWFYIESLFVAFVGVLQVLMSFPIAFFCYRFILGFEHVGVLNAIALFLIIGIGVDDVFVFYGVFRQCRVIVDEPARAAKTFRLAAKTTFITSFTTAVAFATSIPSGIPALSLFGWYMTLLVAINWLMCVSLFFCTLLVWDRHIRPTEESVSCGCFAGVGDAIARRLRRLIHTPEQPESVLPPSFNTGDRFFHVRWSNWIHRARYVLIVLGALIFGLSILAAVTLTTSQKVPNLFPANTPLQNWLDYSVGNFFSTSSLSVDLKYGCDNVLGSGKVRDKCGVCGGRNECSGCDGVAGSFKEYDRCGVCGGSNACVGCDGVPFSGVTCGSPTPQASVAPTPSPWWQTPPPTPEPIWTTAAPTPPPTPAMGCVTSGSSCVRSSDCCSNRCAATTTGMLVCMVAPTPKPTPLLPPGCDGVPGSFRRYDQCGVCGGDGRSCLGCDGVPFSTRAFDRCGVCGGDGQSCVGCDGVPFSRQRYDQCGVCGGDHSSCLGCDGVPFSGAKVDQCGVCRGNGDQCRGCDNLYKYHVYDSCGVCNGNNDCIGCDGVYDSPLKYDLCGVCNGTNACIQQRPQASQIAVFVMFGVADIDRTGRSSAAIAAGDVGTPVYDEKFNFDNPSAQLAMLELMQRLSNSTPQLVAGQANSFMPVFYDWIVNVEKRQWPVPVGATQLLCEFVAQNRGFQNDVVFYDEGDKAPPLVPMQPREARKRQQMALTHCQNSTLRLWGARMRFSSHQIDAGTGSFAAYAVYQQWEALFAKYNDEVGDAAGAHAAHTSDVWVRVLTEVGAVNGVIYGVVISSVIALVCLLIFTSNFLVALLAIFSQIATMFSTLAMYWLAGWTMGVIEAISITVLVGLSIDYFFHLAEAYSVSGDYGRRERTRDALTRMGISVLAGAITTAGSVALVLGAQIEIFFKFGLIVVVNTLFSIVWVYVFFCAYLTTVGPSGDFGSMKRLWRMIGGLFRSKSAKLSAVTLSAPSAYVTPMAAAHSAEGSLRSESSADASELRRPESTTMGEDEVVVVKSSKQVDASDEDDEDDEEEEEEEEEEVTEEPSSEMSFGDLKDRKVKQ